MSKRFLIIKPFLVYEERGEGQRPKKHEYKPGIIVDEEDVPGGHSGEVWCSEAHGLAEELPERPA